RGRARPPGRDRHPARPRRQRPGRLLAPAREDQADGPGELDLDRRPLPPGRRRVLVAPGPGRRHAQGRRPVGVAGGDGAGPGRAPGRLRVRGRPGPGRRADPDQGGGRRPRGRRRPAHPRAPGLVQGPAAAPRVPAHRRVHRRAAQDHHRQDPALQAARHPGGGLRRGRGPARTDGRMIDGIPLVDVHLHPARRPTLKVDWQRWALEFGRGIPYDHLYGPEGAIRPDRFDASREAEGRDVPLLMSEHSPRVTGIQAIEDLLPLVEHNPRRFRPIANLNPHLHHPILDQLHPPLARGAAAVKLHPVHGGFSPTEGVLYLVYQRCAEQGVPVVFHTGTSTFPGALNRFGDPAPIDELIQHVPDLTVVLAHGGRGWWYDTAAFLALVRPNVWIDLSGPPPRPLPASY